MAALTTRDRVLQLLEASPQYASMAAQRLSKLCLELDQPHTDQHSTDAQQLDLLARISEYVFKSRWETRVAAAQAMETVGMVMRIDALCQCLHGPADSASAVTGLVSLADFDIQAVIREGQPLLATRQEEYNVSACGAGVMSREELERRKVDLRRRLGMTMDDDQARTAHQYTDLEGGWGIRDGDLMTSTQPQTQATAGRKRKLEEMDHVASHAGEPWLAEQLGVRLFDAKWEARHGAALGLMALFKAWRQRAKDVDRQMGVARWSEDVACRCLCLLALDRFGDFSLEHAVAPIRETAAQLLALVMASRTGDGDVAGALQSKVVAVLTRLMLEEEGGWEGRHGGFLGLKYLVAVPTEFVRSSCADLLSLGLSGLDDAMDDVRDAAAVSVLSILQCRPSVTDTTEDAKVLLRAFEPTVRVIAAADDSALHLPSCIRLARHCLDTSHSHGVHIHRGTWSTINLSVEEVVGRLWLLSEKAAGRVRVSILGLLRRILEHLCAGETTQTSPSTAVLDDAAELAWRLFVRLQDPSLPAEFMTDLASVWRVAIRLMDIDSRTKLCETLVNHVFWPDVPQHGLGVKCDAGVFTSKRLPGEAVTADTHGAVCELCGSCEEIRRGEVARPWRSTREMWRALGELAALPSAQELITSAKSHLSQCSWATLREGSAVLLGSFSRTRASCQDSQDIQDAAAGVKDALSTALDYCLAVLGNGHLRMYDEVRAAAERMGVDLPLAENASLDMSEAALRGGTSMDDVACLSAISRSWQRRIAAAAAAALIGDLPPDKLGTLIRALMEMIKGESDKERVDDAVDALVRLVMVLLDAGKARKAVDKLVANLCTLSCAPVDQVTELARTGARDVLRRLTSQLSSVALEYLPALWDRVNAVSGETSDAAAVEAALRLILIITPHVEGESLQSVRSFRPAIVEKSLSSTDGHLINKLACRCFTNMLKRGEAAATLHEALPILTEALSSVAEDSVRAAAAQLMLETATVVRSIPGNEVHKLVPLLLPVCLSAVADHDPAVRVPTLQAFRQMAELVPLLSSADWGPARGSSSSIVTTTRAQEDVMRLVLGQPLESYPIPPSLISVLHPSVELRPYQWEGIRWLSLLRSAGLHGALCDDMGLGKTLQALAAVALARCEEQEAGFGLGLPSLVVCPSSLTGHWYREARRFFTPTTFEPVLYMPGMSAAERSRVLGGDDDGILVVTSYGMLRRDMEQLCGRSWGYVIFDEAHVMRNDNTAVARAARQVKAMHRVALTGTPLQNSVQDLWSVFDLLMPGLLGDKKVFAMEYGRPIGRATLKSAGADVTAQAMQKLEKLHAHLLPFILRREKGSVLRDLPPKVVMNVACELAPLQQQMYEAFCKSAQVQEVLRELKDLVGSSTAAATSSSLGGVKEHLGVAALRLLQHLRLLCVHPALVLGRRCHQSTMAKDKLMAEVEASGKMLALQGLLVSCGIVTEFEEHEVDEGGVDEGGEEDDLTMQADMEVEQSGGAAPNEAEEGESTACGVFVGSAGAAGASVGHGLHRCLIFAQHRDTLDAVERGVLRRARWNQDYGPADAHGTRFLRLDGQVPSKHREDIVQRFNRDVSVPIILLTTKVGSLGLNLTGADTVIFLEHDWNPQVDLQAMDRAHRIGQQRTVNVYRLVTAGTVEEHIMALQRRKRTLAETVVTEANAQGGGDLQPKMASVLDLVSASDGTDSRSQGPSAAGSWFDTVPNAATQEQQAANSDTHGLHASTLSEDLDDQYSAFEVQAFLANVLS